MKLSTMFLGAHFVMIFALSGDSTAQALETGLSTGNALTAIPFRGQVSVTCREGTQTDFADFRCTDLRLAPSSQARFVTEPRGTATQVTLTSTWENGKVVKKSSGFDPVKGTSTQAFNLWVATLLQRPLLNVGTNRVHYQLKKNGQAESQGEFNAVVQVGQTRTCRPRVIHSANLSDCRDAYNVCLDYFRLERDCR